MPLETISFDLSTRGIASIILNRPDRGNAFNQRMLSELGGLLSDLAQDTNARVIVLRGSGKHFCSGADVSDRGGDTSKGSGPQFALPAVLAALDTQPKPTVAVVQGAAVGGGAAFAACCDVLLASEEAFFSIPEVRIGMAPVRLAPIFMRAMGYRSFRRYGMSGERFGAIDALRLGFAHQVCPMEDLEMTTADIVDAMLHGAPGALRELKQAVAEMATLALPHATAAEESTMHDLGRSPEAIEGIASFREKRKPSWYPI